MEPRPIWHRYAACRGQLDLFVRSRGESYDEASAICAECPCIRACRNEGDEVERGGSVIGFRAGETAKQRMKRRRAARKVAA